MFEFDAASAGPNELCWILIENIHLWQHCALSSPKFLSSPPSFQIQEIGIQAASLSLNSFFSDLYLHQY